jgi:hypothetical protein
MNARVAKFIRKTVYGELSLRQVRKYKWSAGKKGEKWGTIEAVGKRQEYQQAKKLFYQKKKENK